MDTTVLLLALCLILMEEIMVAEDKDVALSALFQQQQEQLIREVAVAVGRATSHTPAREVTASAA